MEFDRDLYQKAFSRIALSDKKREEILHMTEQKEKRRKPLGRRMLVAAVTALLAAILAMGANAADGELGESFVKLVDSVTQNEVEIKVYEGKTADNQNMRQLVIKKAEGDPSHYYATVEIRDGGSIDDGCQLKYVAPDDGTAEGDGYQIKYYTKITPIVEVENNGSESVIRVVDGDDAIFEYSVDEENDAVTAAYNQVVYYTYEDIPTMFASEPEE